MKMLWVGGSGLAVAALVVSGPAEAGHYLTLRAPAVTPVVSGFSRTVVVTPGDTTSSRTAARAADDKKIVVHHVAGSSLPHCVGTDQVRHYAFSSDGRQLTLSLKSGDRITQTLTWERLDQGKP